MKNNVLSKTIVLMLVLVLFAMTLPVSAAHSVEPAALITTQDIENEENGSESVEEEDGTKTGEAYINVNGSSWLVVAGYGFFTGSITRWNSSTGINFGVTELIAEQQGGTLNMSGYDRVTFYGWVRCYKSYYDFIANPTYYTEHFIDFTV